ncbi:hypothetical protein THOB06_10321 [Vibrio rotiferianus]|nr:hypothetical protein THOG10_10321 [Vibrio rotiferianus]CAH1557050.1 hypothetical protein THOB06_10321 [Vibrio rotiferianus]
MSMPGMTHKNIERLKNIRRDTRLITVIPEQRNEVSGISF